MKINRAYKTELDPNDRQRTALLRHAGTARKAYSQFRRTDTPLVDFDPQGIEATLESWHQEVIDSDAQGRSSLMDNPPGKFTRAEWAAMRMSIPKAYAS